MSNALYTKGKQKFLEGGLDLINDTIKGTLVDTTAYTVDIDNDEFFSDVPAGARISTQTLSGKDVTDGVFNAANTTFTSVPASSPVVTAVVIWKDTGVEGTSALIDYFDSGTGFPTTPNDGNITVVWDTGVNKIFRLQ